MKETFRKTWIYLLLLSMASISIAGQSSKVPDPVYDSSKDETMFFDSPMILVDLTSARFPLDMKTRDTCRSRSANSLGTVGFLVYHKNKGKTVLTPSSVVVAMRVSSPDEYFFQNEGPLKVKSGRDNFEFSDIELTEKRQFGTSMSPCTPRYIRTFEIKIPLVAYQNILSSGKVSWNFRDLEFDLSKTQLKSLQEIAKDHFKS